MKQIIWPAFVTNTSSETRHFCKEHDSGMFVFKIQALQYHLASG